MFGLRVLGFKAQGSWVLGFGFFGLGLRVLGSRVQGLGSLV